MIECDRCGAEFEEQDGYLRHLDAEHGDDLSDLERRRVDEVEDDGFPVALALTAVIVVGVIGAVMYLVMFAGGADTSSAGDVAIEPGAPGSDHYHGPIEAYRGGDRIDLSQAEYQLTDERFHLEGGNGQRWHSHAREVSLEYGLKALGFSEDDWESTSVNGEDVDPASHVLQEGDRVNVTVAEG